MVVMLVMAFFSWWYGAGWKQVALSFQSRLQAVMVTFSVMQLLQTLFAPWRRIITYPGANINERARALADNLFSRLVGSMVRLLVLLAALLALLACGLLTLIEIIVWPLLPLLIPASLIAGIIV